MGVITDCSYLKDRFLRAEFPCLHFLPQLWKTLRSPVIFVGKPFSLEHAPSEVQWWGWSVKWEGGVADWKYCLLHLFSSVFCPFRGCNKIKSKGFPRRFREVPSSGERGEKGSRWGAAKLKVGRGSLWPGLACRIFVLLPWGVKPFRQRSAETHLFYPSS